MNTSKPIALVIGFTGGIGGATARALAARGFHIRALTRRPQRAQPGVEWILGDAMNAADVLAAARGAAVIVHGANPPGYRNWRGLALPMLANTIAAAKQVQATIVFPGTVYNYGPDAFPSCARTLRNGRLLARAPSVWRWSRCCTRRVARVPASSSCAPGISLAGRGSLVRTDSRQTGQACDPGILPRRTRRWACVGLSTGYRRCHRAPGHAARGICTFRDVPLRGTRWRVAKRWPRPSATWRNSRTLASGRFRGGHFARCRPSSLCFARCSR